MSNFLAWLFSLIFAFNLGAGIRRDAPADSELQQKVQDHMDVIVDEAAALVDDVADEVRKNEKVQEAEEFVGDVKEIINNTVDDIHEHFDEKTDEAAEGAAEEVPETETEGEKEEPSQEEAAETPETTDAP